MLQCCIGITDRTLNRGIKFVEITKEQIYLSYKDKVSAYIGQRVSNKEDAKDLIADVFVKVYSVLDTYDEKIASLSTWIYRITHNLVIDYYRSRARLNESVQVDECHWLAAAEPEEEVSAEMLAALAKALKALPERERDVIILRFYHGLSLKQVSERLDISLSNVKYIQHTAINRLGKLMPIEK